jgi:hypothetical protein
LSKYDESSGEEKGESVSISWRNKLRQSLKVYRMILALWALTVKAQENLPLKLITTTPMPGFTGDFDHFGLDLKGNRLFLAAEEHKTVEVFDLQTGHGSIALKVSGIPMMDYLPEANQLVVTDGDDRGGLTCRLHAAQNYQNN